MQTLPNWNEDTCFIPINENLTLAGNLRVPPEPAGIVVFVHGSGSGRFSPRNQFVARSLHNIGIATLLLDLLTEQEEILDQVHGHLRFNIALLSERVLGATQWLFTQPEVAHLKLGYFGASTGAAAALVAAAQQPRLVAAVVSRGGRPDLAGDMLEQVQAPTLLIVGSRDEIVIRLNEEAYAHLHVEKHLEIVAGATHLFEEPGTLEQVATLAGQWFTRHLASQATGTTH